MDTADDTDSGYSVRVYWNQSVSCGQCCWLSSTQVLFDVCIVHIFECSFASQPHSILQCRSLSA